MFRPTGATRLAWKAFALAGLAAVAIALAPASGTVAHPGAAAAAGVGDCNADAAWPANRPDYADQVVALVNQHRASLGLVQLKVSPTLTAAAVWKARHMGYYRYMTHDDPAPPVARTWFQRVQACGYTGYGAGENIAYGYTSPQAVMNGWLNSPGHRANIENGSYRVIGVGAAGSTIYWSQEFGTTDDSGGGTPPPPPPAGDTTAPSVPGLLTATSPSSSQVALTWGGSTDNVGVTGYRVYRGGVQIGTTTGTSYTDGGLAASTPYSYTVRAYDAAGNVGASSNTASVTTQAAPPPPPPAGDATVPSVPGFLSGTSPSSSQVALTWGASTDNVGVTGYRVYRGGVQIGTTATTSYTDGGLAASTLYSYTVRAYDAAGNVGASSNTASVTTQSASTPPPPPPPTGGATVYATSASLQSGSTVGGYVSSLRAQDGSTLDITTSFGSTVAWYARFNVPRTLASLTASYAGLSTQSCTRTLSVYDWYTYSWLTLSTGTAGALTTALTLPLAGPFARYLGGSSTTGEVRIRVACSRSDGVPFTLRTDRLTLAYS